MKRERIENLYLANGLNNFKLKNTEDLLKVHGINFKDVYGYDMLDDVNQGIYEKFIINFLNSWGLQSRFKIIPREIYFVKEVKLLAKEGDGYLRVGTKIIATNRDGTKETLSDIIFQEYKDMEIAKVVTSNYLRFHYEHYNEVTYDWLHVIDETNWY